MAADKVRQVLRISPPGASRNASDHKEEAPPTVAVTPDENESARDAGDTVIVPPAEVAPAVVPEAGPESEPVSQEPTEPPEPPEPPDGESVRPQCSPSSVPTILLAMLNYDRVTHGRPRADLDFRLVIASEGHCDEMAGADQCSHTVGQEPGVEDRVIKEGYVFCRLREAVATGQETALEVFRDWMRDADSRESLLDAKCRHVGFGLSVGHDGRHYWTAILASPQIGDAGPDSPSPIRLSPPVVRGGAS
jgi:uncharacterized protein YkwD